jgi:anaerobic ribonucleoside-triphosphate reductase
MVLFHIMTDGDVEGKSMVTCGYILAKSKIEVEKFLNENPNVFEKYYRYYIYEAAPFIDLTKPYKIVTRCEKCKQELASKFCPDCGGKAIKVVI